MTQEQTLPDMTLDADLHRQIEALSIEYAWLIDHGQADRAAELFADDATLEIEESLRGIAAIRGAFTKRAALNIRSRHVVSNVRLRVEAADRIHGSVLMTVYRRNDIDGGEPHMLIIAEADDVYQLGRDQRWRFAYRRLSPIFLHSNG